MQIAGRVGINPRDAWNPATPYQRLDLVTDNGATFLAKKASTGIATSNTEYWMPVTLVSSTGVTSVAGKTGIVTLVKSDVGLGNVDNTSDLDKPISTAAQNALDDKSDVGHTHSTNDIISGTLGVSNGGTGKTALASTAYSDFEYRGESLNSSDTTPTSNGVIAWTYS